MGTTRYSEQQGSKSQQNPCQVQPTDNIGNLSASRRCLWVRTTVSVWSAASISESELTSYRERLSDVLPINKVIKRDETFSSSRRGIRRQVMRHFTGNGTDQCQNGSSNLLTPYREQRLGLLSPTYGQRSQLQSGQTPLQPVLINKPRFLKATHHIEIRKIEIPKSMVVEGLG